MDFRFSAKEDALIKEINEFLDAELTEEVRRQVWDDKGLGIEGREFARKLGAKGWIAFSWPKEYGGQGLPLIYDYILLRELAKRGAHIPNEVARLDAGPIILRHGSEEMKREFLPQIARGEIEFSLGYSEPEAGSDLTAMSMQALEDGEYYIINGEKLYSSESHYADYHWLAAKTDSNAPRHQGISLFIVNQVSPGITIRPIWGMGYHRTNEVFYDNVRVPKNRLVGEKNKGFLYMIGALNYERIMLFLAEYNIRIVDALVQYAKETRRNGRILADNPFIRHKLAQLTIEIEVGCALERRVWLMTSQGHEPDYESGILKIFLSELLQRVANTGMQILGRFGQLKEDSLLSPFGGEIERLYLNSFMATIGGGATEIIKNVVATRGLGLPK